jgi:CubicO group peptidase (beta-lactamase class C family)
MESKRLLFFIFELPTKSYLLCIQATARKEKLMDIPNFEHYIEKALKQWQVPGAVVGIVRDNQLHYAKGFGVKALGEAAVVDEHTLFPIASISKAFSATAIAMLVDQGKLSWDSRIIDYVPDFELSDAWVTREFQVADIFYHGSGLPEQALTQMATWEYEAVDIFKALKHVKLVSSFRSTFAYNNITFFLAERLIHACTGLSYGDFLKAHIFEPLGMTSSFTDLDAITQSPNAAAGHILDETTKANVIRTPFSACARACPAAGGIISSVADLAQWMKLQLNQGMHNTSPIVSAENLLKTHTPHITIEPHMFYGLGWRVNYERPYQVISHGGMMQGVKTQFAFVPELKTGIIVLSNLTDNDMPIAVTRYFLDEIMGLPNKDHSALLYHDFLAKPKPPLLPVDKNLSAPFERYVGAYLSSILGELVVKQDNDQLTFTMGPQQTTGELHPTQPDIFNVFFTGKYGKDIGEANWGTAHFSRDDQGEIYELTLAAYPRFDNEIFVFEKK